MARKEYEYEIVWVGQPNNVRNNTWKGRAELIDMGYAKMVRWCLVASVHLVCHCFCEPNRFGMGYAKMVRLLALQWLL